MKPKVGIIGYRGIVGGTLVERIIKKKDCKNYDLMFFGKEEKNKNVFKENDFINLFKCNILVCCKDKEYSFECYKTLKDKNWKGYWVDCSSCFRKCSKSTIVLDPINKPEILKSIKLKKLLCGSNCTVSIMLLGIKGIIFKKKILEIVCTSFQSLSGAGYLYLKKSISNLSDFMKLKNNTSLKNLLDAKIKDEETNCFSLIPWIGKKVGHNSEEEIKGDYEVEKILHYRLKSKIKVFSTCVRVNTLRCHALSITIKLKKDTNLKKFIKTLSKNKYVRIIKNKPKETISKLNPNYVSGRSKIFIGRIRKIKKRMFSLFIVGDQLIWGASEPIRRTIKILYKNVYKNKSKILRN
ncbi:aspartate-semialdehyde dehydrogenase [Candidatus Vidania fulgoroideorum]